MLSIRKVKTKSGSTAIKVVAYEGKRSKIVKHIGSGKNNSEISILREKAEEFIFKYSGQLSLFNKPTQNILFVDKVKCVGVTHQFARNFLFSCAKECGLSDIDELLLDLSIMRLLFLASKLKTISMLSQYFGINYSQRIYNKLSKLIGFKTLIEQRAYQLAIKEI